VLILEIFLYDKEHVLLTNERKSKEKSKNSASRCH